MYCPRCRQERLGGARVCTLCGSPLTQRARELIQSELSHVHFILQEMKHWDPTLVPIGVRRHLTERYERQVRLLMSALAAAPSAAPTPAPVQPVAEQPAQPEAAQPVPAVDAQQATPITAFPRKPEAAEASAPVQPPVSESAPQPESESVQQPASESVWGGRSSEPEAAPASAPGFVAANNAAFWGAPAEEPAASASSSAAVEAEEESVENPLPPVTTEPIFDAPQPASLAARIVEETSTWDTVWRPFLYESIGWFLGAFLILAGSLYFVFESWAGMTSLTRSLVVFIMTAGYSAGFSAWGAFLSRRESLRSSGRMLGVIGSAVAPLAGVALGPLPLGDALGLDGVHPAVLVPVLLAWSCVAAWLVRKPAEAFDEPSRPFIQVGLLGSTLMMGLAPLFAKAGAPALWLNALPCALFFLLSRKRPEEPRTGDALAFALGAPLYLLAFFAVRLHLALAAAGAPPSFATYAPFIAFLLATCLTFSPLEEEASASALSIGMVALQVGCLMLAAGGVPPAFFFTAAVFTWTAYSLSRGGPISRLGWLYATYVGAYLSYTTSSQLVPGVVRSLIGALKARLGYEEAAHLPVQFGALSAVPFVIGGVVLAARFLSRAEQEGEARDSATAEVLLRSTAIASPAFVLLGHMGSDNRPAFWAAMALATVCVAAGLYFERLYLSVVGAALTLALPFSAVALYGTGPGSVVCGVLAGVFAALSLLCTRPTRMLFSGTVGVMVLGGLLLGLGSTGVTPVVGLALSGAAALLVAWNLGDETLMALAALVAAVVVPKAAGELHASWVPGALVLVAVALSALGERGGVMRMLGLTGVFYALLGLGWGVAEQSPVLGFLVLGSAAAVAIASRTHTWVRPLAVFIASLALLPPLDGVFVPWTWMTPALSSGLIVLWALGSSLAAARWGRDSSTTTAGIMALVLAVVPPLAATGPQPFPLLLAASLAALLTARALHPSVSVVASAALAFAQFIDEPQLLLLIATVLSVLAVLESRPLVFRVLCGERRFAMAATLSAMALLLVCVLTWKHAPVALLLVGTVVLPMLWTRANREPAFFAFAPLYMLAGVFSQKHPAVELGALVLLAPLLVRAAVHVPAFGRLLLGRDDEKARGALSSYMQLSLMVAGVMLVWRTDAEPLPLCCLAAALVLMPGEMPTVRFLAAAGFLLFVPHARPVGAALLLAFAFVSHHRPAALWKLLHSPEDAGFRPMVTLAALGLVALNVVDARTAVSILWLAGVLFLAAFLLTQRWLLTAATVALAAASLGRTDAHGFLEWRPEVALAFMGVGLLAAALSALCQAGGVQRALADLAKRLSPGLEDTWSEPLWVGAALCVGFPTAYRLLDVGVGSLEPLAGALGIAAALVLMASRERWMASVATGLLGAVLIAVIPHAWAPVVLSGAGLVLCLTGTYLDKRGFTVGAALHHSGWMLALLSIPNLSHLKHPATPLSFLLIGGCAWAVVHRRPEREVVGWLATLGVGHVMLLHLGAVYSTGRGAEFILPYFGAVSAVLATVALFVAGQRVRRWVGHNFTVLALLEVLAALVLVDGTSGAVREGAVACGALALLFVALVRHAAVEEDERSAFLAQWALALGYLGVRLLSMGVHLGTADSLVGLVGGVLFSGLHVFVQREGSGLAVFRRPALLGAFLFPLAGLLTAPWSQPLYVAALLVGHAAHFAALASRSQRKGTASLVSVVAFNAALFLLWTGTGAGEPQYYVIPAGLSLLALLRVFRDTMDADTMAKLRALAITVIYVAGAWKPLMFNDGWAMLLCVFICLVGVGAGIAMRIRSYVYLGSAFLVTCVVANLVRFGARDHRMGAAFLSLLGLAVVGFMVLLSARREELMQRYERVRSMLSTWDG